MNNDTNHVTFDVVIVGGGPAGLSAALALARGRKRVLLVDGGARRNAAARHIHNFVTRDGTAPDDFRRVAEQQLAAYPSVEVRHERALSIAGARGAFDVVIESGPVVTRRVLLCTGMIDELLPLEGFRELWGTSIFQCPYCHGFEVQDQRWAYLARDAAALSFAIKLRGWTDDVVALTHGAFEVPADQRAGLAAAGVHLEERPIRRLAGTGGALARIELAGGDALARDVLFVHPKQRQVDVVARLDLALESDGLVRVDPATRETSVPGIYAAGDLTSKVQGAIFAAAAAAQAAAALNAELTAERAIASSAASAASARA